MTTAFSWAIPSGRSAALRAEPVALSQAKPADAIAEYRKADQLWHSATDALLIGDYTEFDRLMREFRNISREWRK